MVHQGEIIIARDPDLLDMYCCEVVLGDEENKRNLLVRILYMVHYPIQHAILDSSVANENPPIPQGAVCRLEFVRRVTTQDKDFRGYDLSVERCLEDYYQRRRFVYDSLQGIPAACRRVPEPDAKEFEIIERHRRREYQARRVLCTR